MNAATKFAVFGFGAFGGLLPTLASLASTYVASPGTPLPAAGLYFGLLLWAIVGGGIALTNTSTEVRQAIFAGIAAPAIIANLISGATDASMRRRTADIVPKIGIVIGLIGATVLQTAGAEEPIKKNQFPISSAANDKNRTLLISPHVDGGSPSAPIPVTANIKVGDKFETVKIGEVQNFNGTTAIAVPNDATHVLVLGNTISISQPVTPVTADIKTKPSILGDFLWVLGAPRAFHVEGATITPSEK